MTDTISNSSRPVRGLSRLSLLLLILAMFVMAVVDVSLDDPRSVMDPHLLVELTLVALCGGGVVVLLLAGVAATVATIAATMAALATTPLAPVLPASIQPDVLRLLAGTTWVAGSERARRELGWCPRPLDEGLGETLAHESLARGTPLALRNPLRRRGW